MLMDFNNSIRFAAISDKDGRILWNTKRNDAKLLVPLAELKQSLKLEASDWMERSKFEDRNILGKALYHITSFKKVKRVTIPIDAFHILLISVDNEPMKKSKNQSYGKLVEMGKILSILDFVNTFEE